MCITGDGTQAGELHRGRVGIAQVAGADKAQTRDTSDAAAGADRHHAADAGGHQALGAQQCAVRLCRELVSRVDGELAQRVLAVRGTEGHADVTGRQAEGQLAVHRDFGGGLLYPLRGHLVGVADVGSSLGGDVLDATEGVDRHAALEQALGIVLRQRNAADDVAGGVLDGVHGEPQTVDADAVDGVEVLTVAAVLGVTVDLPALELARQIGVKAGGQRVHLVGSDLTGVADRVARVVRQEQAIAEVLLGDQACSRGSSTGVRQTCRQRRVEAVTDVSRQVGVVGIDTTLPSRQQRNALAAGVVGRVAVDALRIHVQIFVNVVVEMQEGVGAGVTGLHFVVGADTIVLRRQGLALAAAVLVADTVEGQRRKRRAVAVELQAVHCGEGRLDDQALEAVVGGRYVRQAQEAGAAGVRVADARCLVEPRAILLRLYRVDRIHAVVRDRTDDIEAIAELVTEGDAHVVVAAVVAAGLTRLGVDLGALELGVEQEVDHTGHGVCAVAGRCTASDGLDALEQHVREDVDVDGAEAVARHDAATIQQHQRAVDTGAAQVDVRATRVLATEHALRRGVAKELRQLRQRFTERAGCHFLERIDIHRRDRRGREHARRLHDTRTGDLHFFEHSTGSLSKRCARHGNRQCNGGSHQILVVDSHSLYPSPNAGLYR